MRPMHFDKQGKPISSGAWGQRFSDPAYRRVDMTELPGGVRVSAVWLGLDHNYGPDGRALIFETMAFGLPDDAEMMDRYSTLAEARAGHLAMVQRLSAPTKGGSDG